jgi:hypothetical protein
MLVAATEGLEDRSMMAMATLFLCWLPLDRRVPDQGEREEIRKKHVLGGTQNNYNLIGYPP